MTHMREQADVLEPSLLLNEKAESEGEFSREEYELRVSRAQELLHEEGLDAMILSSRANFEYFSGFVTETWETPTRPLYLVVPREGLPTAVIPSGLRREWASTSWIETLVTWESPRSDDEGVRELKAVLDRLTSRFRRIGLELGREARIGMTIDDFRLLESSIAPTEIVDCTAVCRESRIIKSAAEIDQISRACRAAGDAHRGLVDALVPGDSELDAGRKFKAIVHCAGANRVPFCAVTSGPGGYESITSPGSDRTLQRGDVLFIDAGAVVNGYFCDFNRNYSIGSPSEALRRSYEILWKATQAGIAAARPGNTAADLFAAQAKVIEEAGVEVPSVGRLGHGLGKLLTEWPSNAPNDRTVLRPGMVLTIEPFLIAKGRMLIHEEDVVVTENGCRLLTTPAEPEISRVPWAT